MNIDNKLTGIFYGMVNGSRVYKVRRGHYQIQNPTRPAQSCFDGTKREIERTEHSRIQRMNFSAAQTR